MVVLCDGCVDGVLCVVLWVAWVWVVAIITTIVVRCYNGDNYHTLTSTSFFISFFFKDPL